MVREILIASPVRQSPEVLSEFLLSLVELDTVDLSVDYLFIDDNDISQSSELLSEFGMTNKNATIEDVRNVLHELKPNEIYDSSHNWNDYFINRVAYIKNYIINEAKKKTYDFLFLVDSDIVLNPRTLKRLVSLNCDMVSNVFWTKFTKTDPYHPQVWKMDQYLFYDPEERFLKNKFCRAEHKKAFFEMLRKPGTYKVGGLGACTLISSAVLKAGVNFSKIYNISFWGEDRSFCIRAVAAGFDLYVDTYYPAYHIYRKTDLDGIKRYKENGFDFNDPLSQYNFIEKIKTMREEAKFELYCKIWKVIVKLKTKFTRVQDRKMK